MASKVIAVVGGTGQLGSLIGEAVLKKGGQLRLLVRPASSAKASTLVEQGATVVQGDLSDGDALTELCKGATVVISSLQGGPETIVQAQTKLFDIARDSGVKRFIPSSFSYNQDGVAMGQNPNTDFRKTFAEYAEQNKGDMEVNHVFNGCFIDNGVLFGFLGAFDLVKNEAYVWGDGKQKMNFLTYADTAAYTAEVALDEETLPTVLQFTAEAKTFPELVAVAEEARGITMVVKTLGTMGDLDEHIATHRAKDPAWENVMSWLPHCYYRAMLDGSGALTQIDNDRYPNVKPTTIKDYLQSSGL
eukprot:TRINITY_DN9021_c0_g2_i2.p2 TRINITY_DN9021_c0_g2~~TRINITY_DN9021_c0_g2_i2.p2  ORF type:complete len:303 (+),score=71.00 TRINITY_DN9021_c0_g2_i2:115-1023(+)